MSWDLVRARGSVYLVLVLSVLVFATGLGIPSLIDFDEAITAGRIREMAETHDYVTVRDDGTPSFRKPPIYYWLSQPVVAVLGIDETSVRAVSGAASVLGVLAAALLSENLFPGASPAVAALLLTTSWLFVRYGRQALLDSTMVFLGLMTLIACVRSLRPQSRLGWIPAAFAFSAGATMTKGPAGLVCTLPLVLMTCFLLSRSEPKPQRWALTRAVLLGAGVFLLIAAPWHLAMSLRHGATFWNEYLGLKITSGFPVSTGGNFVLTYWRELLTAGPASLACGLAGLVLVIRDAARGCRPQTLMVAAVMLLVLSLLGAGARRGVYLMSLAPILAVCGTRLLEASRNRPLLRLAVGLLFMIQCACFMKVFAAEAFADSNREKREVAAMAGNVARALGSRIAALGQVQIPSLVYYSHVHVDHAENLPELEKLLRRQTALPTVAHQADEQDLRSLDPNATLVGSKPPYQLWVLRESNRSLPELP